MLDLVANTRREGVEDNLSRDEEEHAEGKVTQRPAILQRVDDKEDLHD